MMLQDRVVLCRGILCPPIPYKTRTYILSRSGIYVLAGDWQGSLSGLRQDLAWTDRVRVQIRLRGYRARAGPLQLQKA